VSIILNDSNFALLDLSLIQQYQTLNLDNIKGGGSLSNEGVIHPLTAVLWIAKRFEDLNHLPLAQRVFKLKHDHTH
jgi:hypothetical protein